MHATTTLHPSSPSFSENDGPEHGPRRRRWQWVVLAVTLPLLAAGVGLWWFVLRGDAPPPVNLDQALAGLESTDAGSAPGTTPATTGTPSSSAATTWTIDSTITNAQGTGTFGGFRINERLVGVGATTAVGRTPTVKGSLTVSGTTLTAATLSVDLTDITSNDSRRDDAIQRALGTSRYPEATFVLTEPVNVGSVPADGERITVKATGDLTIHGVTRSVTFDLEAQLQGGVLVVVGSAPVTLADYGVTAPTAPIVASVDGTGTIEFQLYFKKA